MEDERNQQQATDILQWMKYKGLYMVFVAYIISRQKSSFFFFISNAKKKRKEKRDITLLLLLLCCPVA
jgi:hypothetical protein